MREFWWPMVLLLAGCAIGEPDAKVDADGDGSPADVDCDDTRADVAPGAPEACDGVDNDCDGAVDVGAVDASTFHADDDADGFGDPETATTACDAPLGYVADNTDCDDADARIHPGAGEADCTDPTDYNCDGSVMYADADADGAPACVDCDDSDSARSPLLTEVCDDADVDEDCDGLADDADDSTDPSTMAVRHRDADQDGYGGDAGPTLTQCEPQEGYAERTGDCDDYDAARSPGAQEVCDAVDLDEDCDGLSDDADVSVDPASWTTWHRDADGDGRGDATRIVEQCEAPSGYVVDAADCDDTTAARSPDVAEVCDAARTDEDCDGLADDEDADVTGTSTWYADADGDTYGDAASPIEACVQADGAVADDTDCDDADPAVTRATTWYADLDGDGRGDPLRPLEACEPPSGYVADAADCDDTTAARSPDVAEVCDAARVDEDCDGLADDDDADVADASTWYADADGDTFGDPARPTRACAPPAELVANSDDCDDTDAGVSPAATESCATPDDDDCDGATNERDAAACTDWLLDADSDGYADPSQTQCLCAPSGGYTVAAGGPEDCDDTAGAVHPGAAETCGNGADEDCDGSDEACPEPRYAGSYDAEYASPRTTDADVALWGENTNDEFGAQLAAGFDFDGDGVANVAVGARSIYYASNYGSVYVYDGLPTASGPGDAEATARIWGARSSSYALPYRLSGIEDFDGDGCDELAVTVHTSSYLIALYEGESLTGDILYTATPSLYDSFSYNGTASSVGYAIDLDFAAVGLATTDVASNQGAVYVMEYATSGLTGSDALTGEAANDYAGSGLGGGRGNDVNGDGYDDIFVGAPGNDAAGSGAGAAYVVEGPLTGSVALSGASVKITGAAAGDAFGTVVQAAGDVGGDGHADLLVGAPYADDAGTNGGVIYLFEDLDGSGADTHASEFEAKIVADSSYDYLGLLSAGIGDVDGDGARDLLVGASSWDDGAAYNAGAAWLVYGPLSGSYDLGSSSSYDARFTGNDEADYCGVATSLADLDADGADELLVGCLGGDTDTLADPGALYIFAGH